MGEYVNTVLTIRSSAIAIQTQRLTLNKLSYDDCDFIEQLVNEASFLKHIGDKQVVNRQSAIKYLDNGPLASYHNRGFGLLKVSIIETGQAIGMCGLVYRDYLPYPDLGFAMLESSNRQGYGYESSQAVIDYAQSRLNINTISAITSLTNIASIGLLTKLGFSMSCPRPEVDELVDLNYLELRLK